MKDEIIQLTDDSFEDCIKNSSVIPVLVDFWADWCGPCKMIAPILSEISEEYQGRLVVAKLNIDHNPVTTPRYNIRSIPTFVLFKGGSVVATKVGVLSKTQMREFVDSYLL